MTTLCGGNLSLSLRTALTILSCAVIGSSSPAALASSADEQDATQSARLEFFEKKVRPLLVSRCYACHSADTKPAGGLRVDDLNGLLNGGEAGAAVVPGDVNTSLLLQRVSAEAGKRRMPAEGDPLTDEQIADLRQWIQDGAVWPAVAVPESFGKTYEWYGDVRANHWAWQPIQKPQVPVTQSADWARGDIDRFILSTLEAQGLAPAGEADRSVLIRRVTYDLTGLAPTQADVDAFVSDTASDAFERVVDRLLQSEAFGEQWGRHWLDVARYGESTGPSRNIPYPHAWRYRDYVIDAFNADVPFNQFIREQIAGDLLPTTSDTERNRQAIATGFLAIGVKDVNQRFKIRFEMDNVDEQIDVVSRSVLGLTVSCARCHDHKFDPIPTTDYYALAGIFTSSENASGLRNQMGGSGLAYYVPANLVRLSGHEIPAPPAEKLAALEAKVAETKAKWDTIRGTPAGLKKQPNGQPVQRKFRVQYDKALADLNALKDPVENGGAVHGIREGKVADTAVRLRGEAEKHGPVVPRGFLTTFSVPGAAPVDVQQSGRLQLADWMTSDNNPLTPRVAVNRIWHHLFGRGIVSTVDNFGTTGDVPSHPELLDHLAGGFVHDGWSVKRLIRSILLSRTYQLSSESSAQNVAKDPSNRWLWRHSPRRLSAEEIRDSMLAASGKLIESRPDGSPARELKMIEIRDNGPEAAQLHAKAAKSTFRSIYLPLLRGVVPTTLEVFDPAEQTLVTGNRQTTNVPGQALFMLNSSFVRRQSLSLAELVLGRQDLDDNGKLTLAWQKVLGRLPEESERQEAIIFLANLEEAERERLSRSSDLAANEGAANTAVTTPAAPEVPPLDPDQVDQTGVAIAEDNVVSSDPRLSAWMALSQALFGTAEFRYVR